MLGRGGKPRADHTSHHQRGPGFATKHVAELSRLVVQRIVTHAKKIHEHQFRDRPQTRRCGAGRHSDDGRLGNGRVDHPIGAELRPQPFSDAEHTAKGFYLRLFGRISAMTATQIFTDEHHAFIAFHFLSQGFLDRFTIGFYCHGYHPQYETYTSVSRSSGAG